MNEKKITNSNEKIVSKHTYTHMYVYGKSNKNHLPKKSISIALVCI